MKSSFPKEKEKEGSLISTVTLCAGSYPCVIIALIPPLTDGFSIHPVIGKWK